MAQIGKISEILLVKQNLNELQEKGLIEKWELPYENLLTRLTAAIFFLTPKDESALGTIWKELEKHKRLKYKRNEDKALSPLAWRVEFNKDFTL